MPSAVGQHLVGPPCGSDPHRSAGNPLPGCVEGIALHSMRLPGLMAHQQIIFGAPGQTLSIRHDAISRECFMPGILLAIKSVVGLKGLVWGLDRLLGLEADQP